MSDACTEWGGYCNAGGYGVKWHKGKRWLIHRLTWTLANGDIPKGANVCHKCDNPACYKLSHLFVGTQADNMKDMRHKGRDNFARGEDCGKTVLTEQDVVKIRELFKAGNMSGNQIAKLFGVHKTTVFSIKYGKSWKHLL